MANPLESLAIELVANVQGFVKDANKAIDGVEKNANDSFGKIEKKATGAFGNVGKAIMGAVGGAVIGGALGALGQRFAKLDETMTGVAARAGLTAEQQDKLTDSTIKLSKANLQSQEEIALTGEALISLQGVAADNTEEIEKLTQQYLDYALVTGQTAPDAVAAFDDILDAWNLTAEDGITIMDALVVSHQKFGTDIVGAQGALNKYASTFQTLGLDVNDAMGYINLFAASGVDAESASTAFTKSVGLLTDGTDASNKKLGEMVTNLGLTADEVDAFSKADPAGQFDILTKAIAAMEDPTLRAQAAIDLFGAKAGPKMAEALAGNGIEDFKIDVEEAGDASSEAADKIQNRLINKLKILSGSVLGTLQEKLAPIAPALMLIGTVGPQAAAGVSGLAGAFLPLLANPIVLGIAAIVAALVLLELKTHVLSETVLPALKQAFTDILPHLKDAAHWVEDVLVPALQRLGRDVLEGYLIPALESLRQGWADLKPLLQDAAERFVNDILPAMMAVAKALTETLLPPLRDVGAFIAEHKPLLIGLALALTALVAPWLAVAAAIVLVLAYWDDIRAFFEGVTLKVQELIDTVSELPIIGEIVQAAFDSLVVIIETAFALILEVVQGQIDLMIGIFKVAMALVQGDFGTAWDEIKALFENQLEHLKDIVDIGLGAIRDLIWIAVQGFVGVISDGAMLFLDAGKALLQALYDGADDLLTNTIIPWIKGLPQALIDGLGDVTLSLKQVGLDLLAGVKTGAEQGAQTLLTWLAGLPSTIGGMFALMTPPPVKWLFDVGVDILQGLVDGMLDKGKGIVEAAVKQLTDWMPGWFKDFLGIGSPAKSMIPIGEAVSEGVAVGIARGADGVQGAVSGIVSTITDGMQDAVHWEWFNNQLSDGLDGITATLSAKANNSSEVLNWFKGQFKDAFDGIAADLTGQVPKIMERMGWFDAQMQDAFDNITADILVGGSQATKNLDWFKNQVTDAFDGLIDSAKDPAIIAAFVSVRDQIITQWAGMANDAAQGTQAVQVGMQGIVGVVQGAGTLLDQAFGALTSGASGFAQMLLAADAGLVGFGGAVGNAVASAVGLGDAVGYTLAQYDLLAESLDKAKGGHLELVDAQTLLAGGFDTLAAALLDYDAGLITADELTQQLQTTFTEVATSAEVLGAQWTTAFADAMQRQDLLEAVGSAGVRVLEQLNLVLTEGGQKNVETLAGMVTDILDQLESELPADQAEALGTEITEAFRIALEEGTPEAVQAVVDLLDGANDAMEAGTTEVLSTVDKFNRKLGEKVADKALQDKVGRNGSDLMDALDTAIKTGGAKGTDTMASEAFAIITAMEDKLEPSQADYLGGILMGALQTALTTGGEGAVGAVLAILTQIQALIDGAPKTIPAPVLEGTPPAPGQRGGDGGSGGENDQGHGAPATPPKPPRTTADMYIAQLVSRLFGLDAEKSPPSTILANFNARFKSNKAIAEVWRKLIDAGFEAAKHIDWGRFVNYMRTLGNVPFNKGGMVAPGAVVNATLHGGAAGEMVMPMGSPEFERVMASLINRQTNAGAMGAGGRGGSRMTNYGRIIQVFGPGRQSKDVIRDLDRLLA